MVIQTLICGIFVVTDCNAGNIIVSCEKYSLSCGAGDFVVTDIIFLPRMSDSGGCDREDPLI